MTSQVNYARRPILYKFYFKRNFLIYFIIFLPPVDVGKADFLSQFYEGGKGGSERSGDSSKVISLVRSRDGMFWLSFH